MRFAPGELKIGWTKARATGGAMGLESLVGGREAWSTGQGGRERVRCLGGGDVFSILTSGRAGRVASRASKSRESDFPLVTSAAIARRAGRASVGVSLLCGSSPDDPAGSRSSALP